MSLLPMVTICICNNSMSRRGIKCHLPMLLLEKWFPLKSERCNSLYFVKGMRVYSR